MYMRPRPGHVVNALVFTPTPTSPCIQGNRRRVADICRAMQGAGAELTMLYYSTDGISPAAARQMREEWGELHVVFPRGFTHRRSFVQHYGIDDWYDDEISQMVQKLCAEKQFDLCIVNYAWYSKLFQSLPERVVRVIDSHDVFGGRAENFRDLGLDPKWFHTSVEEETVGLERADFVVAIQDLEADILRERTRKPIHTVGYLATPDFLPLRDRQAAERLTVGYIGSGNPFNVACMLALAEEVVRRPDLRARVDIQVAGQICAALARNPHPFTLRGVVESAADFYRSVDVVINPMLGGTGLKIKSLEALSFGKPVVATADAMVGIPTDHVSHRLDSLSAMIDRLLYLADTPAALAEEAAVSRRVFSLQKRGQEQAFFSLWSEILAAIDMRRASNWNGRAA